MALPTQNLDFLSLILDASRSDPILVTLDGVTIAKTRFLVTKTGSILMGHTDGTARTHTHDYFEGLYTISPSGTNLMDSKNVICIFELLILVNAP